jgi:fructose-1,6-bisphosphatase/inositol monophosphatase family enzyme
MKFPELEWYVGQCLKIAASIISNLKDGGATVKAGGAFGDAQNDTEILADQAIGKAIMYYLKHFFKDQPELVGRISIEGFEDQNFGDGYWWAVDPLDGSLNYKTRGNTIGLPYSTCITVLKKASGATFSDIIAAGVIDLRRRDKWIVSKKPDQSFKTSINNIPAATLEANVLDLGRMIVIGEFYYPENRQKLAQIFSGQKGWLRNPGSAAYEMALVSSGQAAAYICDRQKQHELGAGYALVKGAGGVAVDFAGNDLGYTSYTFKNQTPVILAANRLIAKQILSKI